MTQHSSVPALAISFVLLGLVTWMAVANPAGGSLFAANASRTDLSAASQTASAASR